MNVQRAVRRDGKDGWRQDHAVRRDHYDFRPRVAQARSCLGGCQRLGLEDFQAPVEGETLYRARRPLLAAARRAVRLGKYQRDVMARPVQRRESSLGEFRGAGENESQEGAVRPICAAV